MPNTHNGLYEFKNFRLNAANPGLWRDGELLPVPPKILATLITLVQRHGEIVSRDELLEQVWQETFVEEGNINYTISQLRKILDDKNLIQTIPKRGYRFTGEIRIVSVALAARISIEPEQIEINNPPEISDPSALSEAAKIEMPSVAAVVAKTRRNFPPFLALAATVAAGVLIMSFAFFLSRGETNAVESRNENIPPKSESMNRYRRGKMILDDRDVENRAQKALDEFQKAVTLDPTSALAYTGLAEGFMSKAVTSPVAQNQELYSKAHAALEKAFALDDNLFEAYLARGWLRRNGDWDWSGAAADLRRAIELQPESGVAHYRLSQLYANTGRDAEAVAEIGRAARLDPLSEMIASGQYPVLEGARQYERALKLAEAELANNSDNPFARRALATFQYHMGDYRNVIENANIALQSASEKRRPFAWLSLLVAAYAKTEQPEKAEEALKELAAEAETDTKALYSLAMNYAELGHIAEALDALEKCYAAREPRCIWMAVEPRFANLRNEPRFEALLQKMNLQN